MAMSLWATGALAMMVTFTCIFYLLAEWAELAMLRLGGCLSRIRVLGLGSWALPAPANVVAGPG